MKVHIMKLNHYLIPISLLLSLFSILCLTNCSSGNSNTSNNLVTINTYNYNPGSKTAVNVSIGNSAPIMAEVDTGSDMTVVNESAVGANITKTNQIISLSYGGGENTVTGYLAYGVVAFTTATGTTLKSSANTPILVVTTGSVNEGGGNNAILGMRMNNQVSVRLYLPSPYNQMMILNRPKKQLVFGQLSPAQLNEFSNIQELESTCVNYGVPKTATNACWDIATNSVSYTYDESGVQNTSDYSTVFDSGEGNASFYFSPAPAWMHYNKDDIITTPITVTANTNKGPVVLPLTSTVYYRDLPRSTANPGNNLFNSYQVLFDQTDGIIGFQDYNNSL
jgi:hypothetical protein